MATVNDRSSSATAVPQQRRMLQILLCCWIAASCSIAQAFVVNSNRQGVVSTASSAPSGRRSTFGSASFSTTALFKKKAKKKNSSSSSGQGFGGGSSTASKEISKFPYAGSVVPGVQSPQRRIIVDKSIKDDSIQILQPDYAESGTPSSANNLKLALPWMIEVKSAEQIENMRKSGKLAREILDLAGRSVKPGVTTDEIDTIVHEAVLAVRRNCCAVLRMRVVLTIGDVCKRMKARLECHDEFSCFVRIVNSELHGLFISVYLARTLYSFVVHIFELLYGCIE